MESDLPIKLCKVRLIYHSGGHMEYENCPKEKVRQYEFGRIRFEDEKGREISSTLSYVVVDQE